MQPPFISTRSIENLVNKKDRRSAPVSVKEYVLPKAFCSHSKNHMVAVLSNQVDDAVKAAFVVTDAATSAAASTSLNQPDIVSITGGIAMVISIPPQPEPVLRQLAQAGANVSLVFYREGDKDLYYPDEGFRVPYRPTQGILTVASVEEATA